MKKTAAAIAFVITLCGCSSSMSMAPDDNAIRDEARADLDADGFEKIDIAVDHGVVTLSGHLTSNTFREKAASDAEKPNGVKRVINRIEVP